MTRTYFPHALIALTMLVFGTGCHTATTVAELSAPLNTKIRPSIPADTLNLA